MRRFYRNLIMNVVGALLPDSDRLRGFAYTPMFRNWQKQHAEDYPVFSDRTDLYDFINQEIGTDSVLQYLEFGVWEGASIEHFAGTNTHAESSLVGFDTFTGYSENWVDLFRSTTLEYFDMDGIAPESQDSRVSFVTGTFQDVLPGFLAEFTPKGQLVIHCDADLYSSTLYVLTRANEIILPGTIIIFDEFYGLMHEFRALADYCVSYQRDYDVIAATEDNFRIVVRMH